MIVSAHRFYDEESGGKCTCAGLLTALSWKI
jgi:hypothetical protein